MGYVKALLEILDLKTKSRAILFIFGLALLLLKPILVPYNMIWFYKKFSWIIILATLFFGATLIADLTNYVISKYKTRKSIKTQDDYILNLSGRKLQIVKEIYEGEGRAAKFRVNDTDLRELVFRNVILQAMEEYAVYPSEENLSNPPMYFLLQPRTLELIEQNPDFFIKSKQQSA